MSKAPIFNPEEEDFTLYIERLELFFKIEDIDNELKKSYLCVNLQPSIYAELKSLLSPIEFSKATYKQCVDALTNKYTKVKKVIAERYIFNSRKQKVGESLADYITEIKTLASNCNFGEFFDNALRDRLVSGLSNTSVVSRLLSEPDSMTFEQACKIVRDMEAVDKSANIISGNELSAMQISTQKQTTSWSKKPSQGQWSTSRSPSRSRQRSPFQFAARGNKHQYVSPRRKKSHSPQRPGQSTNRKTCRMCYKKHQPRNCPARNWICHTCGEQGHVSGFCSNTNFVNMSNSLQFSEPLSVPLKLNGTVVNLLIDTGSAVSLIDVKVAKNLNLVKLSPFLGLIRGINGNQLNVLGTSQVMVEVDKKCQHLLNVIVAEKLSCPAILGRDWLSVLSPNWSVHILQGTLSDPCSLVRPNHNHIENSKPQLDVNLSNKCDVIETLSIKYPKVFSKKDNNLPIKNFKVNVNLKENVQPVFHKAYTVPYALRDEVAQELTRLESENVISKVKYSDWASPMVVVAKPNGKLRLCVDFKATLNKCIKVDQHPIPEPEDIFNKFVGCNVFCRLDLSQAYLQLEVHEASRNLLTVNTIKGLYCFNRLPFGLASACAIFQSVIDSILSEANQVAPYLDDILIGGKDLDECKNNLHIVLSRLEDHNVKLNTVKSEFFVKSLVFLGFELTAKGKVPSASKVQNILSMPTPTNLTELKSFVSMFNYYRRFVHMCPDLLEPFHKLMRKGEPWLWSSECALAFVKAKSALSEATMLVLFDPTKELILSVDSSSYGVGAILSQMSNGKEYPIAFESATLNAAQRNYSQLEKEALACIFGLKKFHKYLWGRQFVICSDHLPLKSIFGENKRIPNLASSKLIRWATVLSAYQYKIIHKKGTLIPHADALSRLPSSELVKDYETNFLFLSTPLISVEEVAKMTKEDPILSNVVKFVLDGFPKVVKNEYKVYAKNSMCLTTQNGCVYFGNRIVVPVTLRHKVLELIHFGHAGITRSKLFARSYIWWPNLDSDLNRTIASCKICRSFLNKKNNQYRTPWPRSCTPWERVHLDLFDFNNNKYLIICDSYSKWVECFVLKNKSDFKAIMSKLAEVFSRFSFPKTMVCDNGPPFCAQAMKEFCSQKNIKLLFSPPYSPQSNGLAERSVQTFKILLSKLYICSGSCNRSAEQMLLECLYTYRITPSSVTGKSPMTMMLAFEPKTVLSHLKKKVTFNVPSGVNNTKQNDDCVISRPRSKFVKKKIPTFSVNQMVWINLNRSKMEVNKHVKYVLGKVEKQLGNVIYLVKLLSDNTLHKVHVNQLVEYYIHKPNQTELDRKKPSNDPVSPGGLQSPKIPTPKCMSPKNSPGQHSIPSPNPTHSPNNTPRTVSTRGRVIKPSKRFTFSEFD